MSNRIEALGKVNKILNTIKYSPVIIAEVILVKEFIALKMLSLKLDPLEKKSCLEDALSKIIDHPLNKELNMLFTEVFKDSYDD